jgi:hypothetical protein
MKKKIVRHAKTRQVKKILPKKSIKKSSKWQFVVAAVALLTVGYLVFKNAVQKSDINMIAPNVFEPAPCGVSDLQLSVSCGDNLFKSADITCADKSSITENTATSCRTAEAWYKEASAKCSNKCMATATPVASEGVEPPQPPGSSPIPSGCWLETKQCVTAPCDRAMICNVQVSSPIPKESVLPSQSPSVPPSPSASQVCTQEKGMCVSKTSSACVTYLDSCQKSTLCATPLVTCRQQVRR